MNRNTEVSEGCLRKSGFIRTIMTGRVGKGK